MNLKEIVVKELDNIRPSITQVRVMKLAEELRCSYPTMLKYLQGEGEKISFYQRIFDHFKNK